MKRRKSFVFKVYEKSALQNVETHVRQEATIIKYIADQYERDRMTGDSEK